MNSSRFKILSSIVIAILLGIAIHFSNPAVALLLLMLWLLSAVFSLGFIVIGLFSKKFKLWYLIGFLPFMVGIGFESAIRSHKHKMAVRLNSQLEEYKIRNGRYPDSLDDLDSTPSLSGLLYNVNNDLNSYRIQYLMDQFNWEYFESKTRSWGTLGWND